MYKYIQKDRSATVIKGTKYFMVVMLIIIVALLAGGCMETTVPKMVNNNSTNTCIDNWPLKLDPLVEKQIIRDWLEKYPDFLEQYGWENMAIIYYGTHNDYVAFLIPGMNDVVVSIKVAGTIFRHRNDCKIHLWKDGSFFEMIDAYRHGFITPENISNIGDIHRNRRRESWIGDDESFYEYYFDPDTIYTIIP